MRKGVRYLVVAVCFLNVAEEIAGLTRQPGKDISISGSGTHVRSLLAPPILISLPNTVSKTLHRRRG